MRALFLLLVLLLSSCEEDQFVLTECEQGDEEVLLVNNSNQHIALFSGDDFMFVLFSGDQYVHQSRVPFHLDGEEYCGCDCSGRLVIKVF